MCIRHSNSISPDNISKKHDFLSLPEILDIVKHLKDHLRMLDGTKDYSHNDKIKPGIIFYN